MDDISIAIMVAAMCMCEAVLLAIFIFGIASRILGGTASWEDVFFGGIFAALLGEGAWVLIYLRPRRRSP